MNIIKVYGLGQREFNHAKLVAGLKKSLMVETCVVRLLHIADSHVFFIPSTGDSVFAEVVSGDCNGCDNETARMAAENVVNCLKAHFPAVTCVCFFSAMGQPAATAKK